MWLRREQLTRDEDMCSWRALLRGCVTDCFEHIKSPQNITEMNEKCRQRKETGYNSTNYNTKTERWTLQLFRKELIERSRNTVHLLHWNRPTTSQGNTSTFYLVETVWIFHKSFRDTVMCRSKGFSRHYLSHPYQVYCVISFSFRCNKSWVNSRCARRNGSVCIHFKYRWYHIWCCGHLC